MVKVSLDLCNPFTQIGHIKLHIMKTCNNTDQKTTSYVIHDNLVILIFSFFCVDTNYLLPN